MVSTSLPSRCMWSLVGIVSVSSCWASDLPLGGNGTASCSCINAWKTFSNLTNSSETCALRRKSDGTCYDQTYGTRGCRPYDATDSPACVAGTDVPEWCAMSWCWVDSRSCETYNSPSEVVGIPMHIQLSYETCGNVNKFSGSNHMRSLGEFRTIRVSFPPVTTSNDGYNFVTLPEGQVGIPGTQKAGAVPEYVIAVLEELDVKWVEVPVSAASIRYSKSSYTSCVHEIALNRTDLCIGDFWVTQARLNLASFTSGFFVTDLHLLVKQETVDDGFGAVMQKMLAVPFDPFTWTMWLGLLLTLSYGGFGMWIVEGGQNDEDFPEGRLSTGLFKSIEIFFGQTAFNPQGSYGRAIVFGLGFLVLVLTASYGAQITFSLVIHAQSDGVIDSFEGAIKQRSKICVLLVIVEPLHRQFPTARGLLVPKIDMQELLLGMDDGDCEAALVYSGDWLLARTGQLSKPDSRQVYADHPNGAEKYHCDTKFMLDQTVFSLDNALPVIDSLQAPISWAMKYSTKSFAKLTEAAIEEHLPPALCSAKGSDYSASVELESSGHKLDILSGGGPLLLSALLTTVAMITYYIKSPSRLKHTTHRIQRSVTGNLEGLTKADGPKTSSLSLSVDSDSEHSDEVSGTCNSEGKEEDKVMPPSGCLYWSLRLQDGSTTCIKDNLLVVVEPLTVGTSVRVNDPSSPDFDNRGRLLCFDTEVESWIVMLADRRREKFLAEHLVVVEEVELGKVVKINDPTSDHVGVVATVTELHGTSSVLPGSGWSRRGPEVIMAEPATFFGDAWASLGVTPINLQKSSSLESPV